MNVVDLAALDGEHFDIIIVGSGFGSSFYLHRLLQNKPARRILVLEWGKHFTHDQQILANKNTDIPSRSTYTSASSKPWNFTIGFGGGTNCWFGQAPRFHPSDFELKSRYGMAADWPLTYGDLEESYLAAEQIMSISGDAAMAQVLPRSGAFPQPPHRMSAPDRLMKGAQPDRHFVMPTARARVATETRSSCCASFRCWLCPVDAKFTANNGLVDLFANEAVQIALNAKVDRFVAGADAVQSAIVEVGGKEIRVSADRFVLGANAIHSPAILLRSDMGGGLTGVGLHESYGSHVEAYLDGLDNFDGSTITTGLNYSLYDGEHRSQAGAALIYFDNRWTHGLRPERDRWRQTLPLMIVAEDLPENENTVSVDASGAPVIAYKGPSDYAKRGQQRAFDLLPEVLAPLPVEKIAFRSWRETESHLQGTLRMGNDPQSSVIDAKMIHHRWRNLTVVGTSVFPTCSAANPSLTAAALSLRAASLA